MSFIRITLFLAAALAIVASASAHKDYHKKKVCFYKVQKCCFKFKKCGYETKDKVGYKKCETKKCENKCENKCYPVYEDECKYVKKDVSKCDHHDHHDYHGKKSSGYGKYGHDKCEPKYENVRVCKKVKKNKCKPVCKDVCKTVYGKKKVVKKIKYAKYCPELKCDKVYKKGHYKAPKGYTSKKGKVDDYKKGKCVAKKYGKHYY